LNFTNLQLNWVMKFMTFYTQMKNEIDGIMNNWGLLIFYFHCDCVQSAGIARQKGNFIEKYNII
jgi:hypothetical protein